MTTDGGSIDRSRLLLVVFGITVVVAFGWAGTTSTTAYDPYNPSSDGSSDLREQIESDPGVEYERLTDDDGYAELPADETVAIVIPSNEAAAEDNAPQIEQFVRDGGTLVVLADRNDDGNALLSAIGAEARTGEQLLKDDRHQYRGPTMPLATPIADHSLTEDVEQLTLDHATPVEPNTATVLATTSEYSYLVGNPETTFGEEQTAAAHPVVTVEEVGDGEVVVVGDSDLVTNSLFERPDNSKFVSNVYEGNDRVLLDLSQSSETPPLEQLRSLVRD